MMIEIGDLLQLELKYSHKFEKFKCKLVERKDSYFYIDYPVNIETNKLAFLIDGTQLKCSFVAQDGSVYLFETEVVRRVKQNIPMLVLAYPGDENLIKIQRRQFVRVETAVDVAVRPDNAEFKPFVTVTDDISAGGLAIITQRNMTLPADLTLHVWLVMPMQSGEYYYLKMKAKVVRVLSLDEERNKISLQFTEITPSERQILLRFCFDRQVAMKKKGLLQHE